MYYFVEELCSVEFDKCMYLPYKNRVCTLVMSLWYKITVQSNSSKVAGHGADLHQALKL
jgi:hypothetical protein